MAHYFRFGWRRRVILRVAVWLDHGRIHDALTEFLYPDDLGIKFE